MRKETLKKLCAVLALAVLTPAFARAQDAASIVDKSRNRIQSLTVSTRSRMVITAKNGSVTERVIDQYSKDGADGRSRVMIVFQSPASVAGTRFLTMENKDRDNDQMIFMPSLGKVRRIAASEGSGSFMGTDLSYDDIASADRETDRDSHRVLREETLNGALCYVIESIPKDSAFMYSKMIQYIDKSTFVNWKLELFDKRGVHIKTMETLELKTVQGRLSPVRIRMSTLAPGTSTTVNSDIIKYDDPIPESVFTVQYLETGRAR